MYFYLYFNLYGYIVPFIYGYKWNCINICKYLFICSLFLFYIFLCLHAFMSDTHIHICLYVSLLVIGHQIDPEHRTSLDQIQRQLHYLGACDVPMGLKPADQKYTKKRQAFDLKF
jgi:hypothetical protein